MLTDESARKLPNSQLAKAFICEKSGKSYRKQKFYEIHVKHGEQCFGTSTYWMYCVVTLTTLRIADFDSQYLNSCKKLNFPPPISHITNVFLP